MEIKNERLVKEDVPILFTTLQDLTRDSLMSTSNMFLYNQGMRVPDYSQSTKIGIITKINDEYKNILKIINQQSKNKNKNKTTQNNMKQQKADLVDDVQEDDEKNAMGEADKLSQIMKKKQELQASIHVQEDVDLQRQQQQVQQFNNQNEEEQFDKSQLQQMIEELPLNKEHQNLSHIPKQFLLMGKNPNSTTAQQSKNREDKPIAKELIPYDESNRQLSNIQPNANARIGAILTQKMKKLVKPDWHAPWELMRVISGCQGWVRAIDIDTSNKWFVTGGTDRLIKFWDLASGQLNLTMPGHISTIRGLAIDHKHSYLFSCSEDKTVKCWDLEYNRIIRNYHGHLSGVYSLALHPELDLVFSGGRDATVRVWDMRTRVEVHTFSGHNHVVSSIISQQYEPQVISGSHDNTIKLWDLAAGKCLKTLTNHKKSVRSLLFHHAEYTFISGAADNMKVWKCPEGEFLRNISGHNAIINAMALNQDNVLVSGADNGTLYFWDWKSGYNFQQIKSKVQPGSISAEGGIFAMKFDHSSMRLITCECDKTIKVWKENNEATPETHPIADVKMQFDKF